MSLSSKLCNLKTEYLELQINYKKTYEELEQLKINNFHNEETLRDKISFFYSPSEMQTLDIDDKQLIRVGGLLKENSLRLEKALDPVQQPNYSTKQTLETLNKEFDKTFNHK